MLRKLQSDVDNLFQWHPCRELLARVAGALVFFHDLMPPLGKSIEPSFSLYTLDAKRAA